MTDPGLILRPLAGLERMVVASPQFLGRVPAPRRPADLAALPWIGIVQPHYHARDRVTLVRKGRETPVAVRPWFIE